MPMTIPTIPDDLEEALRDLDWAIPTIDEMPLDYRRRAFLFIKQANNASTRSFRISNFVEVVKFFHQDSMQ
jgi:uncharacterized protein YdeI (YjbR/CyaY-like superfamily)